MSSHKLIAIDGPVASGKTVVGKLLAKQLRWQFLDTGTMYRAVTRMAIDLDIDMDDAGALTKLASELEISPIATKLGDRLVVNGTDITDRLRHPEVEHAVSPVSKVSGVRTALVRQQRAIAMEGPTVMVGRDIGTVVLPAANLKVFLEASAEVRARRRHIELKTQGHTLQYRHVVEDLLRRDKIDSERSDSPLRVAPDAVRINTDGIGIEAVVQKIVSITELS